MKMDRCELHVLLVEDNLDDVLLIRAALAEASGRRFQVTHAGRLADGLARLAQGTTDIVLLDLSLPDSRGAETLAAVRAQAEGVPVVVLTGLDDETAAAEALRQGAQDYLVKGRETSESLARVLRYAIERQRLWLALQANEARLRLLIEKNADGVVVVDRQGAVRFVNPAAQVLFGRTAAELLGTLFGFPLVGGETAELDILRPGGEVAAAEMRVVQIEWESGPALLVSLRDITERRRTEEALRTSSNRLAMAIEATGLGIYEHNVPLDENTYHSEQWATILGYQAEELPPPEERLAWVVEQVHPEDRATLEAAYTDFIEGRTAEYDVEIRMKHKSGRWIYVHGVSMALRRDEDGRVSSILGVMQDTTVRKRAEEQVRRNAARAEALARTASRLNARLDLDTVLNAVCEETARALNAPAASVLLYDARGDVLYQVATLGLPPEYRWDHEPNPRALYDEITGRTGPFVLIPDAQADPGLPNADLYRRCHIRTLLGATMSREGQLVGVLGIYSFNEPRTFSDNELALLQGLADQAAQAIANARLLDDNRRQLETLDALYAGAQNLAESLDLEAVAQEVNRICVEVFGARLAWLGRAEPDGRVSVLNHFPAAIEYPRQITARRDDTPEGQGPTGRAIRRGVPEVIPDVLADPPWGGDGTPLPRSTAFAAARPSLSSAAGAPLAP